MVLISSDTYVKGWGKNSLRQILFSQYLNETASKPFNQNLSINVPNPHNYGCTLQLDASFFKGNVQFRFKISDTSQIVCVSLGQNEQYRPIASKIIQYNTNMRSIWNECRTVF